MLHNLTSELRSLHSQHRSTASRASSETRKKPDQVFGNALVAVDSTVRCACAEAAKAIVAAVRAMNDVSSISAFKSATRNPLPESVSLDLELADGRLVGACAAAKPLAAAIHRAAQTAQISLSSEDRVNSDDVVSSCFSLSHSCRQQQEQAASIRHAAFAVSRLSQMASESRVAIALVRDEAERIRVQRLRFAKCGVLVNPIDQIVDIGAAVSTSDLLLRGSAASVKDNASRNVTSRSSIKKPASPSSFGAAVGGPSSATSISSLGSLAGFTSSALSGASSFLGGARDALSSTTATVTGVVTKIANNTTDKIVSAIAEGGSGGGIALSSSSSHLAQSGTKSADKEAQEQQLVASIRAAAAKSADRRSLHSAVDSINKSSSELRWRKMLPSSATTNDPDDRQQQQQQQQVVGGLQLEHQGLTTKLRNESVNAAKEMELAVRELGRMTAILQEQVSLQSDQLLVIERNTEDSVANISKAKQELDKHNDDGFWSFKRILAAIVWAHTLALLIMHVALR